MADDGMDILEGAGAKGKEWNKFAEDFNTFVNRWGPFIDAAKAGVGKALDTVTDADIKAHLGGQPLLPGQYAAMRKHFKAAERFTEVEAVSNELPLQNKGA